MIYHHLLRQTQVVSNNNSITKFFTDIEGAFFGAFFAFIFGLLAFYVQKKRERWILHKNAVVEIEYLLNDHLDDIAANQYLMQGASETLKKGYFTYNIFNELRLPKDDIRLRLADIDLINKFMEYQTSVNRLNNSMVSWNRANQLLRETILSGKIDMESIKKNQTHLLEQVNRLNGYAEQLSEDTTNLLSYIRVYLKKDKNMFSMSFWKITHANRNIVEEKELKAELKELKKEIEQVKKDSKEKIEQVEKNIQQ